MMPTLRRIEGKLPKRAKAIVIEWAVEQRDKLEANWEHLKKHEPLAKITPLARLIHEAHELIAYKAALNEIGLYTSNLYQIVIFYSAFFVSTLLASLKAGLTPPSIELYNIELEAI
jgi:hypothetical protein